MELSAYQAAARRTAVYPDVGDNVVYPTLGLSGEAGEIAEKIKKVLRDRGGVVDETARADLGLELGDVLWYVSQLAAELDLDLDDIAVSNLAKLESRARRDMLGGSGDHR